MAEAAAAPPPVAGALVFDLNYHEHTTEDEAGALCRQLTMSFAANRRAAKPFPLLLLGGVGVPDCSGTDGTPGSKKGQDLPPLIRLLETSNWWASPGVQRSGSATPWQGFNSADVVYLTADSPNALEDLAPEQAPESSRTVYVVGGIVDRVEKPGLSYRRAVAAGLRTARLPLEKFLTLKGAQKAQQKATGCRREAGGDDVTTLAVVQMLLLFRESGRWGDAISRCPALRCAPVRTRRNPQ